MKQKQEPERLALNNQENGGELKNIQSSPRNLNAARAGLTERDNMAAASGRYHGDGGRASKRLKTEDGGMTTVSAGRRFRKNTFYCVETGLFSGF